MKVIRILFIVQLFCLTNVFSQDHFSISLETFEIEDLKGVQSYSFAVDRDGNWIVLGGRKEGVHGRRPFEAFQEEGAHESILKIYPEMKKYKKVLLDGLSSDLQEQLSATNHQFIQFDGKFVVIGGYGFSKKKDEFTTYPFLTVIDIDGLSKAIDEDESISSFFSTKKDNRFAVTGGQLNEIDGKLYQSCGQRFEGAYNPMGPDHGPGFEQAYIHEIRSFKLVNKGPNYDISDYSSHLDTLLLHRRDYSTAVQIFPNGEKGYTIFSGVFQKEEDLPFTNLVNVTKDSIWEEPNFEQYLCHYLTANIPIYDNENNEMHTVFFGGMAQFSIENGVLKEDKDVPAVNTISMISRNKEGEVSESKLNIEMPGLLGAAGEFIPIRKYFKDEVLELETLPQGKTMVGYIYGGIKNLKPNVFFDNDRDSTMTSNTIFKVFIEKGVKSEVMKIDEKVIYSMSELTSFNKGEKTISFYNPRKDLLIIELLNTKGEEEDIVLSKVLEKGNFTVDIDVSNLKNGPYLVVLKSDLGDEVWLPIEVKN